MTSYLLDTNIILRASDPVSTTYSLAAESVFLLLIDLLTSELTLLAEKPEIFTYWLELVTANNIKGKRTHDLRLLAAMKAHKIENLLTFNPQDFIVIPGVNIIHPQEIVNSS